MMMPICWRQTFIAERKMLGGDIIIFILYYWLQPGLFVLWSSMLGEVEATFFKLCFHSGSQTLSMHLMQQTNIADKFQETGDVGIGILLLIDSPTWFAQFVVAAKYEGDLSGEAKWEDQNQTCGNNKLFLFPFSLKLVNSCLKSFLLRPKIGQQYCWWN